MKKVLVPLLVLVVLWLGLTYVRGMFLEKYVPIEGIPEEVSPDATNGVGETENIAGGASVVVRYTEDGYLPSVVTISRGDTVVFVNESGGSVWPASAIHPTHAAYPTTGGCVGSTFDACRPLNQGEVWAFVFDELGAWNFHDHLNPSARGTITVK